MGNFFPEQKGGSAPIGWFFLVMGMLGCGASLLVMVATETGFFQAVETVLTAIYEVIDEFWEK
jgi:hypothetical protein